MLNKELNLKYLATLQFQYMNNNKINIKTKMDKHKNSVPSISLITSANKSPQYERTRLIIIKLAISFSLQDSYFQNQTKDKDNNKSCTSFYEKLRMRSATGCKIVDCIPNSAKPKIPQQVQRNRVLAIYTIGYIT